ncbi:anti-sigma factor antagonist [Pseudonocardia sp. TRM90224]|uniref:anti-sigma factor antagonist n=1 Tax=Pseudonocardia sp. TRM90224 TaxID=2812678 RepID=UPI001E4E7D76|nr:anti-sigma factor antagonist [Pseudonocardia sp. TRM90224]
MTGQPTPMSISTTAVPTSSAGSAVVVAVHGELDLHTAPALMAAVDDALGNAALDAVVIDLSDVEFLGSSGLGVLANIATRASAPAQGGTGTDVAVRVVAPADHRPVTRPWEAMNLQQIIPLYPSVDDALAVTLHG